MQTMTTRPTTENEAWGFFGTCRSNGYATDVATATTLWNAAIDALIARFPARGAEWARWLLDSRTGRHLADQASFCVSPDDAVDAGVIAGMIADLPTSWFNIR